jgi:hypothetical protein
MGVSEDVGRREDQARSGHVVASGCELKCIGIDLKVGWVM